MVERISLFDRIIYKSGYDVRERFRLFIPGNKGSVNIFLLTVRFSLDVPGDKGLVSIFQVIGRFILYDSGARRVQSL